MGLMSEMQKATGRRGPSRPPPSNGGGSNIKVWIILLTVGGIVSVLGIGLALTLGVLLGALFIYARFIYAKQFQTRSDQNADDSRRESERNTYDFLRLYPTVDNRSYDQDGFLDTNNNIYVLLSPKSIYVNKDDKLPVHTQQAAAHDCDEYGVSWRLLTYNEASDLSARIASAARRNTWNFYATGSKVLSFIAMSPIGTSWSFKRGYFFDATTAVEDRYGEEVAFRFFVDRDSVENTASSEQRVSKVRPGEETELAICADLGEIMQSSQFTNGGPSLCEEWPGKLEEIKASVTRGEPTEKTVFSESDLRGYL
jgi:hypothetical protein